MYLFWYVLVCTSTYFGQKYVLVLSRTYWYMPIQAGTSFKFDILVPTNICKYVGEHCTWADNSISILVGM